LHPEPDAEYTLREEARFAMPLDLMISDGALLTFYAHLGQCRSRPYLMGYVAEWSGSELCKQLSSHCRSSLPSIIISAPSVLARLTSHLSSSGHKAHICTSGTRYTWVSPVVSMMLNLKRIVLWMGSFLHGLVY
jgi:hypothetical protein